MRVLLTGGAGYIGSHIALVLLERGHDVTVFDDFSNSRRESILRVEELTGQSIDVVVADLADRETSNAALRETAFEAAIHLAGLKAVGESVEHASHYYRVNLNTTLNLLDIMQEQDVRRLVFSSSATVYGAPESYRISESHRVGVGLTSPYGWTKAMNEQIIRDVQHAWPEFAATLLRYFNPVGAHPSGRIGEDPSGVPNNLLPYIAQVAVGRRDKLEVFGDTYPTPDGTGVRDYIHVMDLAEGHVAALENLSPGISEYNLGSGKGTSVLELIHAFVEASGQDVPYEISEPRPGDVATSVADPTKANEELGWRASRTIDEACRDAWAWQSQNPFGFAFA